MGTLFPQNVTFEGFHSYLVGDFGYLLLPWLLTPFCDALGQRGQTPIVEHLYNRELSRADSIVENAFGILK